MPNLYPKQPGFFHCPLGYKKIKQQSLVEEFSKANPIHWGEGESCGHVLGAPVNSLMIYPKKTNEYPPENRPKPKKGRGIFQLY